MKKLHVLIIASAMNLGGIENQLMHLLRRADKARFQIQEKSLVTGQLNLVNYQGGKWYKLAYDLLLINDSLLCHSPSLKYYE